MIRQCVAGLCLFIVAMGINRYAFTPIMPFLVHYQWANTPQAGYIGAANFFGYFVSVCFSQKIAQHCSRKNILLFSLVGSVAAVLLCSLNWGYAWQISWRFVAGFLSGMLMIFAPAVILDGIPYHKKALVSSIAFTGVGIGTIIVSVIVGLFNQWGGMTGIWLGLAGLTFVLSLIARYGLTQSTEQCQSKKAPAVALGRDQRGTFMFIMAGYALYTFGVTPSQLFLSDYAHQVVHVNLHISSTLFSLFGVGCLFGSLLSGWLHQRLGNYLAVLFSSGVGIISCLLILFVHSLVIISVSAVLTGFYVMTLIVLTSLFVSEMVDMQYHPRYWSYLTLAAAGMQFLGSYFFSYMLSVQPSYIAIFKFGLYGLVASFLCYAWSSRVGVKWVNQVSP